MVPGAVADTGNLDDRSRLGPISFALFSTTPFFGRMGQDCQKDVQVPRGAWFFGSRSKRSGDAASAAGSDDEDSVAWRSTRAWRLAVGALVGEFGEFW